MVHLGLQLQLDDFAQGPVSGVRKSIADGHFSVNEMLQYRLSDETQVPSRASTTLTT